MTITFIKMFFMSREITNNGEPDMDLLTKIVNDQFTLLTRFENKMENEKFRNRVLNKRDIMKDIVLLKKTKQENKQKAITKIIQKYLD